MTIPPTIAVIKPDNKGAPPASAIPRHSGAATKKKTTPYGRPFRM
jgi:hypothetical protein